MRGIRSCTRGIRSCYEGNTQLPYNCVVGIGPISSIAETFSLIHILIMRGIRSCTGWRRLIGSPKLQIIFHKRATKYRALLRKMSYKDKGSYESSPPCRDWPHIFYCRVIWQFPLIKLLHSYNPPNQKTQISRYLAIQIQMKILV